MEENKKPKRKYVLVHTQENKKKRGVIQYDRFGNFLNEWETLDQIKLTLDYSKSGISKACNGVYTSAYECMWRFRKDCSDENGKILQKIKPMERHYYTVYKHLDWFKERFPNDLKPEVTFKDLSKSDLDPQKKKDK